MLGFAFHAKYFHIYLKNDVMPLTCFKLGSCHEVKDTKPVETAIRKLKLNPKFNSWRQAQ